MPTPSEAPAAPLPGGAEIDAALCRGTLYAALALGFRPPSEETVTRLAGGEANAALADAARLLDERSGTGLVGRVRALRGRAPTAGALDEAHRRLFGHTARGEVPAYETEYGNEALFQQPQELGDLAGFVAAFGLELRPDAHERIDHVSCECEFMAFLAYKEAYALDAADEPMLAATRRAAALFLGAHLGRFAAAFAGRIRRCLAGGFHAALAALLLALIEEDCRRLGVAVGPEALGLRPDPALVAAPMGCEAGTGEPCGSCP